MFLYQRILFYICTSPVALYSLRQDYSSIKSSLYNTLIKDWYGIVKCGGKYNQHEKSKNYYQFIAGSKHSRAGMCNMEKKQ